MAGFRRRLAQIAGELAGVHIVHPAELYQLPELTHLKQFFEHFRVDCVFDVGGNEGQYGNFVRNIVGYRGRIISFEPIPDLAAKIEARSANDPLWTVENVALDAEAGPATFNVMALSVFSSLHAPDREQPAIFDEMNRPVQQIQVMRATLDEEYRRLKAKYQFTRPYLKMDTQGNDLAVVRGGGSATKEFVGLQSELAVIPIYEGAPGYVETLAAYEEQGFKLSAIVANTRGHFPDLVEMDCIMYRADLAEEK